MAQIAACRYHCPNCDIELEQEGYILIDAKDVDQLQALLEGQINIATCQNCGTESRIPLPLLYHDLPHELLICYVPNAAQLRPEDINAAIEYPYSTLIGQVAGELGVELPLPAPQDLPHDTQGEAVSFGTLTPEEAAKLLPGYLLRPTIVDGFEVVQAVVQAVQEGLSTQLVIDDMARLQLINGLLNTTDPIARRKVLHHSEAYINDELYEVIDTLSDQMNSEDNVTMSEKLAKVRHQIENYRQSQDKRLAKVAQLENMKENAKVEKL